MATQNDNEFVGKRFTVFAGIDLSVHAHIQLDTSLVVVTFSGRSKGHAGEVGAGEGLFEKRGISAVYFVSKVNNWWQSSEFDQALKVVSDILKCLRVGEVVTYGASMGGYGALAAAKALGAIRAVVAVPQYTVDPTKVPWDDRFSRDARKIKFILDDVSERVGSARVVVISDPYFTLDQCHVDLIARTCAILHLRVPFSCHDALPLLSQSGMISGTVVAALKGTIDSTQFRSNLRHARRKSWLAYIGAARIEQARGRLRNALRLAAKAYSSLPPAVNRREAGAADRAVESYTSILAESGRPSEALDALKEWSARRKMNLHWLAMQRGKILEVTGNPLEAFRAYIEALSISPCDRKALAAAARLLPDVEETQKFYDKYGMNCVKYPPVVKALALHIKQHLGEPHLEMFLNKAALISPQDIEKLRRLFKS